GGMESGGDAIQQLISEQVDRVIDDCDVVLFLTDGRGGMTHEDQAIADKLRRIGKPIFVVVNKSEGLDPDIVSADFYSLGVDTPHAISAAHGDGVNNLMAEVLQSLPKVDEEEVDHSIPRVAVIGRPNVGKSTLINALLGDKRVMVYDSPGTTRDSVQVPFYYNDKEYLLVDTAGVRRRSRVSDVLEKISIIKTLQTLDAVNVVLLILDAQRGVSDQDATLAGMIQTSGRSLIMVVNKWDGLGRSERNQIRREIQRKLLFISDHKPLTVSALYGSGLGEVIPAVDRAYASAMINLKTHDLNQKLREAVQAQQPPMVGHQRSKLKFAHQGGKNPPQVIVHGTMIKRIPESYRRYLENYLNKAYKLYGTSVKVLFKQGANPFSGRTRPGKRTPSRRSR
ncbi:ribosome biogenesis GTPase Der, partial [Pseudomonadota bacterium]